MTIKADGKDLAVYQNWVITKVGYEAVTVGG